MNTGLRSLPRSGHLMLRSSGWKARTARNHAAQGVRSVLRSLVLGLLSGTSLKPSRSGSLLVDGNKLLDEVATVANEFLWLNLVVVVGVHAAEDGVDKLVSHGKMHVILLEEHCQEVTQLLAVDEAVFVLVEFVEVLHDHALQVVVVRVVVSEFGEDVNELTLFKFGRIDLHRIL